MMSHFADLFIEATRKPIVTVLAGAIDSKLVSEKTSTPNTIYR